MLDNLAFAVQYGLRNFDLQNLINFKIILLSIVIEAFPFVLFSVLISAGMNHFLSENTIQKYIPKNTLLSLLLAALLGILFPVCDCGMVPIVRRLLLKGVPLRFAITFMLAAPIINPVVATATWFAFNGNSLMLLYRLAAAFAIACCAGLTVDLLFGGGALRQTSHESQETACSCGCHASPVQPNASFTEKIMNTFRDAGAEFFDMGKYLLLGAMLGAALQLLLPRQLLLGLGQDPLYSVIVMLLFAFSVSVCSSADAFIAASFSSSFTPGSLIAFMVFGPMIDAKNLLMLLHVFKTRFVATLTVIVILLCGGLAYLLNAL